MEQQLADKLAQQQADLDEQLAFVQVGHVLPASGSLQWQFAPCFHLYHATCLMARCAAVFSCRVLVALNHAVMCCAVYCIVMCAQAKLQKAQQQREYAKAFHADVLKKLAAEDVAQQVRAG
jgi:hypothetical protein